MNYLLFILLIWNLVWFSFFASTWIPPWPKKEELNVLKDNIRLRDSNPLLKAIGIYLNSYILYPLPSLLFHLLLTIFIIFNIS